ncbi:MAG TPA: FecR domain-containing protein [Spirochaetia bacterium]|nr:FecR domain-containing protein [Spirochaetia bacterium]
MLEKRQRYVNTPFESSNQTATSIVAAREGCRTIDKRFLALGALMAYLHLMNTRYCWIALLLLVGMASVIGAQTGSGLGTIEFLQGDVRVNGRPADFGLQVAVGDWIQTGPNAAADIVFDRANVFRLGPNTVARLNLGASRQEVDLKFGSMSAVFDRVRTLSGRGTFDVRTPTTVGGVRGTSFFFRVIDGETTYVCTCNGTLELSPFGRDSFLESATRHSAYFFRQAEDGSVTVERGTEAYHSTESLNRIADSIGVSIPWGELPD